MFSTSSAAMSSDDLRLNSLDRFRKSKSGLTLEVYSSCEVPAGCGGAVLRWRRPGAPIMVCVRNGDDGKDRHHVLRGGSWADWPTRFA